MNRTEIKTMFGVDIGFKATVALSLHHLYSRDALVSSCYSETSDLSNSAPEGIGDRLVQVLNSFGIRGASVKSVECGPVLVRLKVVLPTGVKISAVESLCDDIAMGLRVSKVSCTKVLDLGYLGEEVVEVKLVACQLLGELLGFLLVELLLCLLHERYDVAHAEDTVGHA